MSYAGSEGSEKAGKMTDILKVLLIVTIVCGIYFGVSWRMLEHKKACYRNGFYKGYMVTKTYHECGLPIPHISVINLVSRIDWLRNAHYLQIDCNLIQLTEIAINKAQDELEQSMGDKK